MVNDYVIDGRSVDVLRSKYLLLDTNFLIDTILFRKEAVKLIAKLRELNCGLVATRAVITEFLGGTKNADDLRTKILHLEIIFGKPLSEIIAFPVDKDFPKPVDFLNFSRQCKKFGPTDFELYLTLKKYKKSNLLLVSRNHLDFTGELFKRDGFVTLLGNKEIRTYGLYSCK